MLGNTREHFITMLGAILSGEVTKRKHKNTQNVALNTPEKRILVSSMKAEKYGEASLCSTSAGVMCALGNCIFHFSMHEHVCK